MPKVFDDLEVQERRLKEDKWFFINQPLLLWLVNTDYGRDMLCIPKAYGKIVQFNKNMVRTEIEPGKYLSDFRIGTKYGNGIRQRWKDFSQARDWYYDRFDNTYLLPSYIRYKKQLQPLLVATTVTAYPDPDVESATVDGIAYQNTDNTAWGTLRAGAGSTADDTAEGDFVNRVVNGSSSAWKLIQHGFFLYDTSAIPDTESILSATHSLRGSQKLNEGAWSDTYIGMALVSSAPLTNVAIIAGDFDSLGTTRFATDVTYSAWSTSGYNAQTLNASGLAAISVSGVTKFGTMLTADFDNSDPGFVSANNEARMYCIFAETALTTTDPKLVVISGVPGGQTTHGPKLSGPGGPGAGSAGGSHGF